MAEPTTALTDALCAQLQEMNFVLLHTVDADNGTPTASAISWIYAVDASRLRLAIDARSRLVANLKTNPRASVTIFGQDTVYSVSGTAVVFPEHLEGVPFPLACADIEIDAVRDAMYYGSRLSAPPEVAKTYDQRAADRLDAQVFDAMKKAQ